MILYFVSYLFIYVYVISPLLNNNQAYNSRVLSSLITIKHFDKCLLDKCCNIFINRKPITRHTGYNKKYSSFDIYIFPTIICSYFK